MFHFSKPSCTHRHRNSRRQPRCPALCLPSSLLRVTFLPPFFMPQPRDRGQKVNLSLWEVSFFNCFQSTFQGRAPGASSVPPARWLPLGSVTIQLVCHALQSLREGLVPTAGHFKLETSSNAAAGLIWTCDSLCFWG